MVHKYKENGLVTHNKILGIIASSILAGETTKFYRTRIFLHLEYSSIETDTFEHQKEI